MINNIESLFNFELIYKNNKNIINFKMNNVNVTELKVLKFIQDLNKLFDDVKQKNMNNICFIFHIDYISTNTNLCYLKEIADVFVKNKSFFMKNLLFTIIKSNNTIYKLFINCFKMYYKPIKPLYFCTSTEQINDFINNKENKDILLVT